MHRAAVTHWFSSAQVRPLDLHLEDFSSGQPGAVRTEPSQLYESLWQEWPESDHGHMEA